MPSWVQDRVTGKLIPKELYRKPEVNAPTVIGDVEDFVSPITREVISDRGQLRRHNKKHGVTDYRDYSEDFKLKASAARSNELLGQTPQAQAERREALNQELRKRGI